MMDAFSVAETATTRERPHHRTSVVGKGGGGGGRSAESPAWGALPPAADWGEQQRSSQQLSWWRGTSSSPSAAVEPRARGGQASARATTGRRAEDDRQKAGVAELSRREEKERRDEPAKQGLGGGPRNVPDWNEQQQQHQHQQHQQHGDSYASASASFRGRARHDDAGVDHGLRDLGYTGGGSGGRSTENSREPRHPAGGGGGGAGGRDTTAAAAATSSSRPADQLPDHHRDHHRNDWQRGGVGGGPPPPAPSSASSTASAWPAPPSAAGQVGVGSRRSAASASAAASSSSSSSSGFLPPAADWTEQRSAEEMAWWRGTRKAPSAVAAAAQQQPPQRSRAGTGAPRDDLPRTATPLSAAAAASSGDHHHRRRRHSGDGGHEQQQQPAKGSVGPPSRARGQASDWPPPPGRAEPLPPEPSHWREQGTSLRDEPPPRNGGDRARDASRKASEPIGSGGAGGWDARSRGGGGGGARSGGRGVWSPAAGMKMGMEGAEAHRRASEGESHEQRYFVELPDNPTRGKGGLPRSGRTPQAPRLVRYSPDTDDWAWPEPRRSRTARRTRTPHGEELEEQEQQQRQQQADDDRWGDVLSKRGGLAEKRSPSVGLQAEAHPLLEEAGTIADLWRLLHPSLGVRVGASSFSSASSSSSSADPFPSVSQPRRSGRVAESSDGVRAAEAAFARRFYRRHDISGGQQQQGQGRRRGGWCCRFCRHASRRPAPDCPVCRHFSAAASSLAGRPSAVGPTARERPAPKRADVGADEVLLRRKSRRMGVNPLERNKAGLYLRQHLKEMRGDLALIRRQARDLDLLYYQRHPDAARSLARASPFSAEPETHHLDDHDQDDDEDPAAEDDDDNDDDDDEDGEEESEQERALREKVEREAREKERELDRKRWAEEKARDLEEKRRRQEEIDRRRRQEERLEREREREREEARRKEEEKEREAERQQRRREREEEEEEEEAEKERERKKKMRRRQQQQQKEAEEAEAERKKAARKKAQQQQQQLEEAAEKQQKEAEAEEKRRQRREKERRDAAEEQEQEKERHERKRSSSGSGSSKAKAKDPASDAEENEEDDAVETSRAKKGKTKKTRKSSSSGAEVDRTGGAKKKKKGATAKKTRRKRADRGAEESDRESATETEDEDTASASSAAEEESETEADEPAVAPVVAAPVPPPKPSLETGFRIADIEISGSPPATALATGSPVQEAPRGKNLRSRLKERIQNRADTLVFVGKDTFFAKNIDKVPFPELPSDFQVNDRQRREEKELQMLKPVITDFTLPATYDEGWYRARIPLVVKVQTAVRGRLARRRYSKHKERKKIAYEIFTTEKNYMEALAHLHECRRKLEEESKAKVKADKIKVIWQDQLVDMIELARILTARLEAKVAPGAWHVSRELSDVFLDLGPRFAVYVPYIIHYNEALEALQELTKANKRFQQFSEESSRAFRFLDFAAILIMPIQRIPRYILLLKALIKITPRSHPDYDQLNKALDLMSTIATDINNQVKKYENHLTVCKIDSLLVPRIKEFVQPDREFVGSGMVIMYDDKKKLRRNKQKVRTVFLFSDVFLLAKHIPASGVYHLKFMIYLNPSVHVEHNPYVKDVGNEHVDCVFRLHSDRADQSITLMTRTMDEKISWLIALEQTLFLIKDKQAPKSD